MSTFRPWMLLKFVHWYPFHYHPHGNFCMNTPRLYIDKSAHLWSLSVAPLNLDVNFITLLVINWNNLSCTKPFLCPKKKSRHYQRSYFLCWSFSYIFPSLREELMSIYHIWHFHYRGDDGKGTCKGGPHHALLCLFL